MSLSFGKLRLCFPTIKRHSWGRFDISRLVLSIQKSSRSNQCCTIAFPRKRRWKCQHTANRCWPKILLPGFSFIDINEHTCGRFLLDKFDSSWPRPVFWRNFKGQRSAVKTRIYGCCSVENPKLTYHYTGLLASSGNIGYEQICHCLQIKVLHFNICAGLSMGRARRHAPR